MSFFESPTIKMLPVGSRTPVSILHEYFIAQRITPTFQFIGAKGSAHQPTFTFRVTAGEYFAEGSGWSKQKAKHDAAQQLLDLIQSEIHKEPAHRGDQLKTVLEVVACPQDNCLNINAVGSLLDYCFQTHNPEPKYLNLKEEGPPHQRVFTCQCQVSTLSTVDEGRTKKEAKQKAAYAMLLKLKELYHVPLNEIATHGQVAKKKAEEEASTHAKKEAEEESRLTELDERMNELYFKHSKRARPVVPATACISHFRAYSSLVAVSPTLSELLDGNEELMKQPYATLTKLANECQIALTTDEIRSQSGAFNSVFVKLHHVLPITRNGIDTDHASRRILEDLVECVSE